MSVRCAVCETLIVHGQPFALQDRFVIHRTCAGGIVKVEQHLADVRRQVAALDPAITRMRAEYEQELSKARVAVLAAKREIDLAKESREAWRDAAETRLARMQALQAELDLLRQAAQGRAQVQPVPVASRPVEQMLSKISDDAPEETADGTAIRFGLLELD